MVCEHSQGKLYFRFQEIIRIQFFSSSIDWFLLNFKTYSYTPIIDFKVKLNVRWKLAKTNNRDMVYIHDQFYK